MAKTETIRIRMEPSVKMAADNIFSALGLSASDAVTLFYKQVELNQGLPFEVKIPNKETRKAMRDSIEGHNLKTYNNLDEFKDSLGL